MKLALASNPLIAIQLDAGLVWKDEFTWSSVSRVSERSVEGSLIIDINKMEAGRPITLEGDGDEMGWIERGNLKTLYSWAETEEIEMVLSLEYPTDTRTFNVTFRSNEASVIEAKPVKGHPGYEDGDWYKLVLKLETL